MAAPTSTGIGKSCSRPFLPRTRRGPLSQSQSSSCSVMISCARSPRRARSSSTARSRRPIPVSRSQLSIARCACSGDIALGTAGVVVQAATAGTAAASAGPLHRDTARSAGTSAWRSRRISAPAVADDRTGVARTQSHRRRAARANRPRRVRNARGETAWRRFCSARSLRPPAPADPEDVAQKRPPVRQPLWSRSGRPGRRHEYARIAADESPRNTRDAGSRCGCSVSTSPRRWYRSICTSPRSADATRCFASQRSNASACRALMATTLAV